MGSIEFKEQTVVIAEDQDEYRWFITAWLCGRFYYLRYLLLGIK